MFLSQAAAPAGRRAVRTAGALLAALVLASQAGFASSKPPKGATILFSGKAEELAANWVYEGTNQTPEWKLVEGGAMESVKQNIVTKEKYTDFLLHVEFKVPYMPNAHGQGRGNSGVGLQGRYEIQVLDSYGKAEPGSGDCGAVYSQTAPLVNACKKPLQWQTYDIAFRAPRFDEAGTMTEKGSVTVWQNGVLVQNNTPITHPTGLNDHRPLSEPGWILLQYHHNAVQFRNVWVLPLPLHGKLSYE